MVDAYTSSHPLTQTIGFFLTIFLGLLILGRFEGTVQSLSRSTLDLLIAPIHIAHEAVSGLSSWLNTQMGDVFTKVVPVEG